MVVTCPHCQDRVDTTYEMRPYGLRRSIRCPKKYGEGVVKERPDMSILTGDDPTDPIRPEQQVREEASRQAREDRCRVNAACLPDLHQSPEAAWDGGSATSGPSGLPGPLLIHGYTVPEYQQAYHSVVDPLLLGPCEGVGAYSLELGRTVKHHLFQELCYPTLQISERLDGRLDVVERFCVLRSTPVVAVDMSGEPPCFNAATEKDTKTCPAHVV